MVDDAQKSSHQIQNIKNDTASIKVSIDNTKDKIRKGYSSLDSQVENSKERKMLTELGDRAYAEGTSRAITELENYVDKPKKDELKSFAMAEILRIKSFYASGTRLKGISITTTFPDGTKKVDIDIPTIDLIKALNNLEWTTRAKAAELLGTHKEKGVPEALMMAFQDKRLDVARTALSSFELVTGFNKIDVFGFNEAKEWWEKNKSNVKTLNPLKRL